MELDPIGEEDIKYAHKLLDQRHPLQTLCLLDAIPALQIFTRCFPGCLTARRNSGKGPKKLEDWLKKRLRKNKKIRKENSYAINKIL